MYAIRVRNYTCIVLQREASIARDMKSGSVNVVCALECKTGKRDVHSASQSHVCFGLLHRFGRSRRRDDQIGTIGRPMNRMGIDAVHHVYPVGNLFRCVPWNALIANF